MRYILTPLFALALGVACDDARERSTPDEAAPGTGEGAGEGETDGNPTPPNLLVVLADDFGVDVSPCYADETPEMPTLRRLCEQGAVFDLAWSNPICSPTRATILTGRYSFRTGVGSQIAGTDTPSLPLDEFTLAQALKAHPSHPYATGAFGKWHLANRDNGGAAHPQTAGFDHFSGLLQGGLQDYWTWRRTVNGLAAEVEGYATTVAVDDALRWLEDRGDEPWFMWMAFVAPHTPFHLPPDSLHGIEGLSGEADDIAGHPEDYYFAAAEALDTEMGRLLRAIEDDHGPTLIVFLGDNGTPKQVLPAGTPRRRGKGSLFAGGIHVPLVLAGAGVEPGARLPHPVNLVDLFPTLLEAAGLLPEAVLDGRAVTDGVPLTPYLTDAEASTRRAWIYSEIFGPNVAADEVGRTIRGPRFKRTSYADGREAMFDRLGDARERVNLLEAALDPEAEAARAALDLVLDSLTEAR